MVATANRVRRVVKTVGKASKPWVMWNDPEAEPLRPGLACCFGGSAGVIVRVSVDTPVVQISCIDDAGGVAGCFTPDESLFVPRRGVMPSAMAQARAIVKPGMTLFVWRNDGASDGMAENGEVVSVCDTGAWIKFKDGAKDTVCGMPWDALELPLGDIDASETPGEASE
jgi:hypothetical protein